jgi:Hfq protein
LKRLVNSSIVEPLRESTATGFPELCPPNCALTGKVASQQTRESRRSAHGEQAGTKYSGHVPEHSSQGQDPDNDLSGQRRKLTGKIRSFDKYSVLLENNSQEQLIFKHAISTVVSNRSVMHTEHRPMVMQTGTGPTPMAVASGSPLTAEQR